MASPPAATTSAAEPAPGSPSAQSPSSDNALNVPNVVVEAESTDHVQTSDGDSAFGDDLESYTTSLKSTVLKYHGFKDEEAKYYFPNDDEENDRLDLYHHIVTLLLGGELHLSPIGNNPQRILDVGTGTGIWAIDMGDKYPSAEVLGNDISPIQPSLVPPNVKFEVDDIEDEWVYSHKFDYIHVRYLMCSIRDWPKLMRQAFKYVKPGGWVEFQDFDTRFYTSANGTYTQDNVIGQWADKLAEALRGFGVEPDPGSQIEDWVKDAGFINVSAKTMPMPVGPWPKDKMLKEVGAFDLIQFLDNIEGLTLRVYTSAYGWSVEEVKVLCAQVRNQFKDPKQRIQHNFYVIYAQKPETAE